MNWCGISINSGGKWLSEPPKLIIWNLNLETLASFQKMFNQQFEIPGHCMSCIITRLILCRSMICMWQCVHIYVYIHMICIDLHTIWISQIYTHIYITWYCICVLPVCLSATMFAGLQELEENMIGPFTLCHAANAGVLNKPNSTTNKRGRPSGLPSVFTVVEAIFNRVSICDHCCATMPNVSGRVWNKKCKCLQEILLHITPQAIVWQNSQWWENCMTLCQIT